MVRLVDSVRSQLHVEDREVDARAVGQVGLRQRRSRVAAYDVDGDQLVTGEQAGHHGQHDTCADVVEVLGIELVVRTGSEVHSG